ncbi:MAG: haloacid dehalogenase-like hydrolase [Symploca sp. SIO1C2]|nr:haloacid dehalogenase-like hydrolase [Symploca sp. SIO1C2]
MMTTTVESIDYCSIFEAFDCIKAAPKNTPIIVDLDETLFLRNSTQEYLNTLQPQFLGAALLFLLSYLKPWNWLPGQIKGDVSRDWLRVVIATLVFPWTLILWRWRTKQLANNHTNTKLIESLNQKSENPIIIATLGFGFIVNPLVRHFSLPVKDVVACRFWRGAIDRWRGKRDMLEARLGLESLSTATVVTDSIVDAPLLSSVAQPCLVVWPEAEYQPAMANVYLPLFYLERVKRPSEGYFFKQVILEDLLVLLLSLSWLSPRPILHAISIFILVLSFSCIYEIGYWENDLLGEKIEQNPVLSKTYQRYKTRINSSWQRQPWIWAIILAIPAIILLDFTKSSISITELNAELVYSNLAPIAIDLLRWLSLLIFVRSCLWIYNRIDIKTRVWVFPLLQITKNFGFLVIATTNIIGAILFCSTTLARWFPYLIYRNGGDRTNFPKRMSSLLIFIFLAMALILGGYQASLLLNGQALAILTLFTLRALRDISKVLAQFHFLSYSLSYLEPHPIKSPQGQVTSKF